MIGNRFNMRVFLLLAIGGFAATAATCNATITENKGIQAYQDNPRYWQYEGKPVLLLGGTDDDNLFQWTGQRLTEQLDLLKSVGGNYIRCTMSGRDEGNVQPFKKLPSGKYDLDQWNGEYWSRFEKLLRLTRDRDVIVQVEVWAFHDFNQKQEQWSKNSWRPANNISYTPSNTTLKDASSNIGKVPHNFFFTVPRLNNDDRVLRYQRKFVDKMLSYTMQYGHVLYCMTNEIHPNYSPEWGWYWAKYIKARAAAAGRNAETSEMYWEIDLKKPQQRASLDRSDVFSFFEASQNSAKMGQENGSNIQFAYNYLAKKPRPINHVKIYGADSGTWAGSTDRHATECFWRNIMSGSASSRFHRPPYGLGLSKKAQAHIKSLRMLTDGMDVFTCKPHNDLLSNRRKNGAYAIANPGREYAVYFPNGGPVDIDLRSAKGPFTARWLDIPRCRWAKKETITGGGTATLIPPGKGHWAVLLTNVTGQKPPAAVKTNAENRMAQGPATVLPYDNTNPVIYDNDWTNDYVDWYLMSLASVGDIKYHGISTSSSVAPYNQHMTAKQLAEQVAIRREIVRRGRDSGFRHIPDPVAGTKGNLKKPPSGRIEDTKPLDSPGSRLIIEEAKKATPTKPLVVCVGGPLTAVADAYLLDNSITDKIVVTWLDNHSKGMTGFNGWSDGWAAYIVLQKIRLVQFTVQSRPFPRVTKSELRTLQKSEAREYMLAIETDVVAPEGDADGPPAISLMRPDYVLAAKRVSFGGWTTRHGHEMPLFKDDPNGRTIVVTAVDRKVATKEWWRAMRNPAAWHPTN